MAERIDIYLCKINKREDANEDDDTLQSATLDTRYCNYLQVYGDMVFREHRGCNLLRVEVVVGG